MRKVGSLEIPYSRRKNDLFKYANVIGNGQLTTCKASSGDPQSYIRICLAGPQPLDYEFNAESRDFSSAAYIFRPKELVGVDED